MSVGEAWIDVTADGSGLPAQVRAMCERAGKWAKIEAEVDLDTKGLISEVKALAKAASAAATIEFDARLEAKELLAKAKALREAAGGTIKYKAEIAQMTGRAGWLTREANRQEKIKLQAEVDFREVDQAIAERLGRQAFHVELDTSQVARDLSQLQATIKAASTSNPVQIPIDLDAAGVMADYAGVKAAIESDSGIRLAMNVDPDTSAARTARDALEAQFAANPVKIPARAELDRIAAERARAEAQHVLGVRPIHIPVDLDRDALNAAITRSATGLAGNKVTIPVDLDNRFIQARLQGIQGMLNAANLSVDVVAEADLSSAARARNAMDLVVRSNPIEVPVEMDTRPIGTAFRAARTQVAGIVSDIQGGMRSIGDALADSKFGNAAVVTLRFAAAQAALVVAGLALAYPTLKGIAVALGDIVLQAGAAAASLGVGVLGGLAAIGVAAATTTIGVSGMGDAFTALNKIWQRTASGANKTKEDIKAAKKENKEFEESLRGLTPAAKDFVIAINDIHPGLVQLQQDVQQALFRGLGDQIRQTAKEDLPLLQTGFTMIAGTLNDMATSTLTWLRSAEGQKGINDIFRISNDLLLNMGKAAGNVGKGVLTLFSGSERSFGSFGDMLEDLSIRFNNWAKDVVKSGQWDDFLKDGERALGDIGHIFEGAGTAVGKFWTALRNDGGKNPLTSLGDSIKGWAENLTTEDVEKFVRDAREQFELFKDDAKTFASGVGTILTGVEDIDRFFRESDGDPIGALIDNWKAKNPERLRNFFKEQLTGKPAMTETDWKDWLFGDMFTGGPFGETSPEVEVPAPTFKFNKDDLQGNFQRAVTSAVTPGSMGNFAPNTMPPIEALVSVVYKLDPERPDLLPLIEAGINESLPGGSNSNFSPNDPVTVVQKFNLQAEWANKAEFQAKLRKMMEEAGRKPVTPGSMGNFAPNVPVPITVTPVPKFDWKVFNERLRRELIEAGNKPVTPGSMGNYAPNIPVNPQINPQEFNEDLNRELQKALTGGGLGGKAGGTIMVNPVLGPMPPLPSLPPIPWPVTPRLEGGTPNMPNLPTIPWPIKPTLSGGLPPMPTLPTIRWPIKPTLSGGLPAMPVPPPIVVGLRYGPLPAFPPLPYKRVLIYSKYLPLPAFPTLPKPKVTIGISWGNVPPPPNLPTLHQTIRITRETTSKDAARGVVVTRGEQLRNIGEAGPEAIVPLRTNQSLDPGVRALLESVAAARGIGTGANGSGGGNTPTVGTLQVFAPTGDPEAVAMSVVNRIAAKVG